MLNARLCICPRIPLACCSDTSDLKKRDPLQKRKQCRTNFRLLGLPRLVPKPQQQAPLQPPFPWLLPQTYTKKHQLYGLRALKHKKQRTENRFGTHVVKPGARSRQIAQAIHFNAPILRYTAVFSKGHMKGFSERERDEQRRRRGRRSSKNAFLMSCNNALTPTTSALCWESPPNFLHP